MTTSALNKFLSIFSIASIATIIFVVPAIGSPVVFTGSKGTYTIDYEAGTYRGCLDDGGCISLGAKYLIKNLSPDSKRIGWKNGEYKYVLQEGQISVYQNSRIIFQDYINSNTAQSTQSSDVNTVPISKPIKVKAANECSTVSECDRAIAIDSTNHVLYYLRGNLKRQLGNGKEAITDYNQAIRIESKYAEAYIGRGIVRYDLGDEQGAIDDCDQAININRNYFAAYFLRGRIKQKLRDDNGAISDYNLAIALNPNHAESYNYRGLAYFRKGGYSDSANADYNQAININPNYAEAYNNRGYLNYLAGSTKRAIADCNQATYLDSNYAMAYYNLGLSKLQSEDKKGFISEITKAAELFRQQGQIRTYNLLVDLLNRFETTNRVDVLHENW
jgi:tetratricopeptide (TPR) repeat protein